MKKNSKMSDKQKSKISSSQKKRWHACKTLEAKYMDAYSRLSRIRELARIVEE